jgi:hypothetical protein
MSEQILFETISRDVDLSVRPQAAIALCGALIGNGLKLHALLARGQAAAAQFAAEKADLSTSQFELAVTWLLEWRLARAATRN